MSVKDYNKSAKQLNITNFAGGWDPTHSPLVLEATDKTALKWSFLLNVDLGVPGGMRRRLGATAQGSALAGAPAVLGLFDYRAGVANTQRVLAATPANLSYYNGSTWSALTNNYPTGGTAATTNINFESWKNWAIAFAPNAKPVQWDQSLTGLMINGFRPSPAYAINYTSATINYITGAVITFNVSQPASGLHIGKQVYLTGGTISPEILTVKSFTTTALPGTGTASYYVQTLTLSGNPQYSNHTSLRWNGVSLGALGTGGSAAITSATTVTTVSVLGITSLLSGGYRANEFSVDIPTAGGPYYINVTSCAIALTTNGDQFASDIGEKATTWYISPLFDPGASTSGRSGTIPTISYYRIPAVAASISTTLNPFANSISAFNIFKVADTTQPGLLADTGYPQQYFTAQVDAPYASFGRIYQNQLFVAGNPLFPSRVYSSAAGALNIWSEAGGTFGSYYDFATNDGDVITGIGIHQNFMYVFKRHSVYLGEYTSNAVAPMSFRKLPSAIGAVNHSSIVTTDWGCVFMSEKGPAYASGSTVNLCPGADSIAALFDPVYPGAGIPTGYNFKADLSALNYTVGAHLPFRGKIYWTLAQASQPRKFFLVYDYKSRIFYLESPGDSFYAIAPVTDSNGSIWLWGGTSNVYGLMNGTIVRFDLNSGLTDAMQPSVSNALGVVFAESCRFTMTGGSDRKVLDRVWWRGDTAASGTVDFAVYNDSGSVRSFVIDLTDTRLKAGRSFPLNLEGKFFYFIVGSSSLSDNYPFQLDSLQFDWQPRGPRV